MIVFGKGTTRQKSVRIPDTCNYCNTSNNMKMYIYWKYVHLFWIPFSPINATGRTECSHCKQVINEVQFSPHLSRRFDELKKNSSVPIWTFSGPIIIGVLIISSITYRHFHRNTISEYIISPKKGDIYTVKSGGSGYSLMKVESVSKDTVFLRLNHFQGNLQSEIEKEEYMDDSSFDPLAFPKSRKELKQMFDDEDITEVNR